MRDHVRATLREHFMRLEGPQPANLYALLLAEVEFPLLERVLQYTHANQSAAAKLLQLSRGTLRKKMKQYGLLSDRKKQK